MGILFVWWMQFRDAYTITHAPYTATCADILLDAMQKRGTVIAPSRNVELMDVLGIPIIRNNKDDHDQR